MRLFLSFILFLVQFELIAQPRVLHYTETSGYDHNTRSVSLQMMQDLASANGWMVTDDQTGDEFNSVANLELYEVVVFSNTSGNAILNANQRSNFETYIANGGSYLGIHAASDTYRHSSANGSNTGTWDFYAELIGASVQQSPNHVSGTPQYSMDILGNHPSTVNLPHPWAKNEEYYYWENGYFGTGNNVVLEVEETVGSNNQVNSYDAPRPMSWYKELQFGGKMFYTALGHASSNFTTDQNFRNHIENALLWILAPPTSLGEGKEEDGLRISQAFGDLLVHINAMQPESIQVLNTLGQPVLSVSKTNRVNVEKLPTGVYLLEASHSSKTYCKKLFLRSIN